MAKLYYILNRLFSRRTTPDDLEKIYNDINGLPKAALKVDNVNKFYAAVENLPGGQPIVGYYQKMVKLTIHPEVSCLVFKHAFYKLYEAPGSRHHIWTMIRGIFNELCYTHQENKIEGMLSITKLPIVLGEIFVDGDVKALRIAIKFCRTEHFYDVKWPDKTYIDKPAEAFDSYFATSLDPEMIEKRELILQNNDLLSIRERVNLFQVLQKNEYPCEGLMYSHRDLSTLLEYIVNKYQRDITKGIMPEQNRLSFLIYLLESFPDLMYHGIGEYLLQVAWDRKDMVMYNFFKERYPEASVEERVLENQPERLGH